MIAVHLGIIDEEAILDMSGVFFEDIIAALGHKLNYDAIVNYAGNSFCAKSWEMIQENNPFNVISKQKKGASGAFADFLNSGMVKIKGAEKSGEGKV